VGWGNLAYPEEECLKDLSMTGRSNPILWNIKQASEVIGIPVGTIYCWVHQKKIPFIKVNGRLMFDPKDIQAWLDAQKVVPLNAG